jgi:four helix bundle protein
VASNIAEGRGRLNAAEFRQFLGFAQGSIFELRTQLQVAKELGFVSGESFLEADALSSEVSKMLRTFIQRLSVQSKHNIPTGHTSPVWPEAEGQKLIAKS